ncbi:hypothetical protein AMEX_G9329 [Astyanax mexicanus]|uniref:Uncharacterized protein n=1 Tax=Astyanax mexicanus TaxID=7994 RepID=A0A8T2LRM3_ASTMX|nr:hypothetical protein AMEX_G9329 [Astyanax mexicanus]
MEKIDSVGLESPLPCGYRQINPSFDQEADFYFHSNHWRMTFVPPESPEETEEESEVTSNQPVPESGSQGVQIPACGRISRGGN